MWDITQSNPLLSLSDSTWTNSAEIIDISPDNSLVSAISWVELGTWKIDPIIYCIDYDIFAAPAGEEDKRDVTILLTDRF